MGTGPHLSSCYPLEVSRGRPNVSRPTRPPYDRFRQPRARTRPLRSADLSNGCDRDRGRDRSVLCHPDRSLDGSICGLWPVLAPNGLACRSPWPAQPAGYLLQWLRDRLSGVVDGEFVDWLRLLAPAVGYFLSDLSSDWHCDAGDACTQAWTEPRHQRGVGKSRCRNKLGCDCSSVREPRVARRICAAGPRLYRHRSRLP